LTYELTFEKGELNKILSCWTDDCDQINSNKYNKIQYDKHLLYYEQNFIITFKSMNHPIVFKKERKIRNQKIKKNKIKTKSNENKEKIK